MGGVEKFKTETQPVVYRIQGCCACVGSIELLAGLLLSHMCYRRIPNKELHFGWLQLHVICTTGGINLFSL